jgi:hypothetical protein
MALSEPTDLLTILGTSLIFPAYISFGARPKEMS